MQKAVFVALVIVCTLSACIKAPTYSIIPAIKFVSVSSNSVRAGYRDSIIFSFTDGDGDIGTYGSGNDSGNICGLQHGDSSALHSTSFNVFLIDSRDSCLNELASADVEPTGKYKAISGQIVTILGVYSKTCYSPPNPTCKVDTVVYTIILKDKAGHFSNAIQTSKIACDPRY